MFFEAETADSYGRKQKSSKEDQGEKTMNELKDLVIMKDGKAVTTSLEVAKIFEKRHTHVIRAIESKLTEPNFGLSKMVLESTYADAKGKQNKMYYLNRDGFTFIAMGFTGHKADEFKLKYIEAFNQMEAYIRKQEFVKQLPQTPEELLQLTMKATNHLNQRVTNVEEDIDYLKNTSEINSNQRFKLRKARDKKSVEACGGKKSNFYQDQNKRRKVFRQLEHDFKDAFVISRYEDLSKKDFDKALNFIANWYPSYPLQQNIKQINVQTNLDI